MPLSCRGRCSHRPAGRRARGYAASPLGGSCQRPRPLTDEGRPCRNNPFTGGNGGLCPHPACGHLPPKGKAPQPQAFSPWGRRWPAGRMRGELSLVARFFAISPFKHKRTRACARVFYASYYRAFLAVSTRALKLAGSWMAISLSILRFSSMPDFFRPFMKVE